MVTFVVLILWGARSCAFGSKNCSHCSKRVIYSLSDHKVIVYRCREQRVFRNLNIALFNTALFGSTSHRNKKTPSLIIKLEDPQEH